MTPKETDQSYLLVLESLLWRHVSAVAHHGDRSNGSSSSSPGRRGYDGEDCSGRSALTVHRVGGRQETDEPTDDADPGEAVGRGRGAIKRPERSMKEHRP